MKNKTRLLSISLLCTALCVTGAWAAADPVGKPGRSAYKPNPLNNIYFGEQHLHTQNSADAALLTGYNYEVFP